MPILIRELHIKVSVNAPEGGTSTSPPSATAGGAATGSPPGPEEHDRLIARCVEQVLDILRSQQEA